MDLQELMYDMHVACKPIIRSITPLLTFSELRSCVKVEVHVLGSPSLIFLMVSGDVKQH